MGRIFITFTLAVLILLIPASTAFAEEKNPVSKIRPFVEPAAKRSGSGKAVASQILKAKILRRGLFVVIGCIDGSLPAALSEGGKNRVHGITNSPDEVAAARSNVYAQGVHGSVVISYHSLGRLPYATHTVNALIVENLALAGKNGLKMLEVVRVLAPYGTAFIKGSPGSVAGATVSLQGGWTLLTKKRPKEMADWSQMYGDGTRSSSSSDMLVGPSTGLQWVDGAPWVESTGGSRASYFVISGGGRNFYLMPGKGGVKELVARDAFNGFLLWKKRGSLPARGSMIAVGDFLYADTGGSVKALDAASGKEVKDYKMSGRNMTYADGILLFGPGARAAVDARSGKVLWKGGVSGGSRSRTVMGGGRAYFHSGSDLVSVDIKTGKKVWQIPISGALLRFYSEGVLVTTTKGTPVRFQGISARDGKKLWEHKYTSPLCNRQISVFPSGGMIWMHAKGASRTEFWSGVDPKTGKEKSNIPLAGDIKLRCFGERATQRFLIGQNNHFVDIKSKNVSGFYGSRGNCGFANIMANGLYYQVQNTCACFLQIRGLAAFSSGPVADPAKLAAAAGARLKKGPAFGKSGRASAKDDWPMHRHDGLRSGIATATVPSKLKVKWSSAKGRGKASAPTVVGDTVYFSAVDESQILALDAATGKRKWNFLVGGAVDSAPSYHKGLLIFGSRDGYVYALNASSGKLAWRFRAAPEDRRILAHGRVESVWPVFGSVLIEGGMAYFASGRQSEVDGGMNLFALNPSTGRAVWETQVIRKTFHKVAGKLGTVPTSHNDILVSDGKAVYLPMRQFDLKSGKELPRVFGTLLWGGVTGFTTDNTEPHYKFKKTHTGRKSGGNEYQFYNRSWTYTSGTTFYQKIMNQQISAAHILCARGTTIFGINNVMKGYRDHPYYAILKSPEVFRDTMTGSGGSRNSQKRNWSQAFPMGTRLMAVLATKDSVFVAGLDDPRDPKTGKVWIFDASSGKRQGEVSLGAYPTFDGMAAAGGKLFVSVLDGRVICLGD